MYKVFEHQHPKYGDTIQIQADPNGDQVSPFRAVNCAFKLRRLILEEGLVKVKIILNNQVINQHQAEQWAQEEYEALPKCFNCAKVLEEEIYTHSLVSSELFCSNICADKDYTSRSNQSNNDEHEWDN